MPASAPAEAEKQAIDAEATENAAEGAPTPRNIQAPEPPPASAPVLEQQGPVPEESRKDRAKSDDLADAGFAAGYSLPKALAAIERFDAQLSAAVALSAPNCPDAEGFRRSVCQLAERICVLEDDLPSSGQERHCGDSRARCVAATSRYRQSCQP
jgi:hypothetical protein